MDDEEGGDREWVRPVNREQDREGAGDWGAGRALPAAPA